MDTQNNVTALNQRGQNSGFDWRKILRGDASRFANVWSAPDRWRTGNPIADRQAKYITDNARQFKIDGGDRFNDRGRELMSTTADAAPYNSVRVGMPENADSGETAASVSAARPSQAQNKLADKEREYDGGGEEIAKAQKDSQSQFSKPATAAFNECDDIVYGWADPERHEVLCAMGQLPKPNIKENVMDELSRLVQDILVLFEDYVVDEPSVDAGARMNRSQQLLEDCRRAGFGIDEGWPLVAVTAGTLAAAGATGLAAAHKGAFGKRAQDAVQPITQPAADKLSQWKDDFDHWKKHGGLDTNIRKKGKFGNP